MLMPYTIQYCAWQYRVKAKSHRILGIPLYPCTCIHLYLAILQQIHGIPLYPTVPSCIRTYIAVSSCICCFPLYLTVSHRLENGIWHMAN